MEPLVRPTVYLGVVIDNKDPDRLGRLQIRVPQIHGVLGTPYNQLLDKDLPWARYLSQGCGSNDGVFVIPDVGSLVYVIFEDDDYSEPICMGTVPRRLDAGQPQQIDDLYEDDGTPVPLLVNKGGVKLIFKDGSVKITIGSYELTIDETGIHESVIY